ncbi:hypothetical protein COT63_02550 [Candidatus Shapirobacteria bacterium CG09_land_8_20_14_0_10_38_17]|uniref:Methyltransferase domain-containing protein n=1 Tax=Candidatus Shapirobacteria bacterium CG09_land_8_20_14_0_10_38_17 TaxID=1974884 RepID=A0A2H0WQL8_9BACT|nr:MAG: hypothetical protein COT63_02550 [Candidatus Shapirobacteria bacterium CG09_land_8_20_14_0_10_38_17]
MSIGKFRSKTNERPRVFEGTFLARYIFASKFIKSKEVLDLGTGLGNGAYYLSQKGAKYILAIDYSAITIKEAKKKFILPNLEFKTMNALNISSLKKSFDVITAFELIEHLPINSYSSFLNQIKKTLAPNGICFISTPNKLISSPHQKNLKILITKKNLPQKNFPN